MDEYDRGYIDGLTAYAHWKDGKQWVGTSGETLAEALEGRKTLWNYKLIERKDDA